MQSFERRLGLFSVISISLSSMIGSGIFVLPGIGFSITGPSLDLAFFLAALIILPAAMSKAELATAMPTSGGSYVYLERTFGPLAGTISGLGLFFSILLKASFSLVGIGAYLSVLSNASLLPIMMGFLAAICLLNILGIGKVSGLVTFAFVLTIVGMLGVWGLSIPFIDLNNLTPFFTDGVSGLAAATALVFVSYAGVTKVAAIAGEVKDPGKNMPSGMLISLLLATILYCTTSFILSAVFELHQIVGDHKPIYTLGFKVGGEYYGVFMAVVAILTMANVANAGVLAGSRFPFAMSRDHLLPSVFGKLHGKFLTPYISIIFACLMIAMALLFFDITKIVKLASAFMIIIFMMENIAVIVLRESRSEWYRPEFKSPLYPGMQIVGAIASLALLLAMGVIALVAVVSISAVGCVLYFFYSRERTDRKGVLGIKGKRSDLIEGSSVSENENSGFFKNAKIVVSLFGQERSPEMLVEMGIAMTDKENENVEVVRILEIPEQTRSSDIAEPPEVQSLRRRVFAMANDKNHLISFDSVTSHDVPKTVFQIGQRVHCEWMIVEWQRKRTNKLTFNDPVGWLKSHLHCHLAFFRDNGVRYIRKILVLLNDDSNDQLVTETAEHLSRVNGASLALCRYGSDEESQKLMELKELGKGLCPKTEKVFILQDKNKVNSIVDMSAKYDLLVLGSSSKGFWQNFIQSEDDEIFEKAYCSVVAVHGSEFLD